MRKKKTAVLIYNSFCNFEISVALEILAMSERKITIFAKSKELIRSEEGLQILPEATLNELVLEEFNCSNSVSEGRNVERQAISCRN